VIFLPSTILFTPLYYILALFIASSIALCLTAKYSSRNVESIFITSIIVSYVLIKAVIPFSTPNNVIDNFPDAYYEYQIADLIETTHHVHIDPSLYTGEAVSYCYTPNLAILGYLVSEVTTISLQSFFKYIGLYTSGVLLFLLSMTFFRRILKIIGKNNRKVTYLATSFFMFSPWVMGFLAHANHSTISVPLLFLVLFLVSNTLTVGNSFGTAILYALTMISLVFSHFYMSFVLVFILCLYAIAVRMIDKTSFSKVTILLVISFSVLFLHMLYISNFLKDIHFMVRYLFSSIFEGSPLLGIRYYGTPQVSNWFVVVIKYLGFITFMFLGFSGIIALLHDAKLKSNKNIFLFSILTTTPFIVGSFLVVPYIFNPLYGTDLFNRYLFFTYLSLSTYVALYIERIQFKFDKKFGYGIVLSSILLILLAGYFQGVNPYYVDWTTPIVNGDDVRLNFNEWNSLAHFVKNLPDKIVIGLRSGSGPVGGLAFKEYWLLSRGASGGLDFNLKYLGQIGSIYPGRCILLRKSITTYPDGEGSLAPQYALEQLYSNEQINIVYSASDAFIIKT
jgi:hypothetical protein